jgi:hypothetical protein
VRRVFEPQPIFDQPVLPGLGHQGVEHVPVLVHTQTLTKVGQLRMMRQPTVQAQIQKEAKRHVDAGLLDHFPIGEIVLVFQEL